MEGKIIESIQHDYLDILLSLLPKDQILYYSLSTNLSVKEHILMNCPPICCIAAYYGSIKCLNFLYENGDSFKAVDNISKKYH